MAGYYTRFLGLDGMGAPSRSKAARVADDLMDEGGRLAEAAIAYGELELRDEVTVVRHAACLLWTNRAGEAISLLEAAGVDSLPAQAVLADAWFVWASGWGNPDRDERVAKAWSVLLPLLDVDSPPWLAFATLEAHFASMRPVEWTTVTAWMTKAMRLYPDDERFCLAADYTVPRAGPEQRIASLTAAWERQPSGRLACRLAEVYAEVGDHATASRFLRYAEELEALDLNDEETVAALRVLRTEQLIRQADGQGALSLALTIPQVGRDPLMGARARLAAACATGHEHLIALYGRELVAALEANGEIEDYNVLWEEVVFIEGPHWTGREHSQATPDLSSHRERLLACKDDVVRSWMRYFFAESDHRNHDVDDDISPVDWTDLAETLGDAALVLGEPRIVLFDTAVRLRLKGEKWREAGRTWIQALVAVLQSGRSNGAPEVGDLLSGNIKRTSTFLRGVRDGLELGAPAPFAFEAVEEGLGKVRLHDWVKVEMADIMRIVGRFDSDARTQFALGYALHGVRDTPGALAAYNRVLAVESEDTSAIFNSLLLCNSPVQAETVRWMATLIDQLDAGSVSDERRAELVDALERAKNLCMPAEVMDSPLALMLADCPTLRADVPDPASVSLRAVVALTALLRSAPPEGDPLLLRPLTQGTTLFSPTPLLHPLLFAALGSALVAVGEPTPADAVVLRGDGWGCHLRQLWWRLSPAVFEFIAHARALRPASSWPASWQRLALDLAREIAVDECVQYVQFLCDDRSWPAPAAQDKLQELAREMIDRYSVSRAYYLFYLGAMAAADRKARMGLTGQHASNTLVVTAASRFESAKAGKYGDSITAFKRSHAHPRSAVSLAFWSDLLDLGDAGFDQCVGDVLGLSPV